MEIKKSKIRILKKSSDLRGLEIGDIVKGSLEGTTEKLLFWITGGEQMFIKRGRDVEGLICCYGLKENRFIVERGLIVTERYSTRCFRMINRKIPKYSKSLQREEEYQELNKILEKAGL